MILVPFTITKSGFMASQYNCSFWIYRRWTLFYLWVSQLDLISFHWLFLLSSFDNKLRGFEIKIWNRICPTTVKKAKPFLFFFNKDFSVFFIFNNCRIYTKLLLIEFKTIVVDCPFAANKLFSYFPFYDISQSTHCITLKLYLVFKIS
jgi:hypothetical protein